MTQKIHFQDTTLIIGAGAHVPYGFPTSQGLTSLIKKYYTDADIKTTNLNTASSYANTKEEFDKITISTLLRDIKYPKTTKTIPPTRDQSVIELLNSFIAEFARSQVYSIDSYLASYLKNHKENANPDFPLIGKLLIAFTINYFERKTLIGFHEFDWIQYIINSYLTNPIHLNNFFANPPTIYTFNYDTHLERSLAEHLQSHHGKSKEDAKKMVDGLNIKHIYGAIDSLEDPLRFTITKESIENILVIGEERATDELRKTSLEISNSLKRSKEVYFLGFGFDEANTRLIFDEYLRFMAGRTEFPNFYSTNFGINFYERNKIKTLIGPIQIKFGPIDKKIDSLDLIRNKYPIFEKRTDYRELYLK